MDYYCSSNLVFDCFTVNLTVANTYLLPGAFLVHSGFYEEDYM